MGGYSFAKTGDTVGAASSTDNAVARFDGTTGKVLQSSPVTIEDSGATVIPVTAPVLSGSQDFSALSLNITNANHTGSGNTMQGVKIPDMTFDAQATATAFQIGSGWSYGMTMPTNVGVRFGPAGTGGDIYYDGTNLVFSGANVEFSSSISFNRQPAVAYSETNTTTQYTTPVIPLDNTIPQNTEGVEVLTATINLKSTDSKVRVTFKTCGAPSVNLAFLIIACFRDSGADAIASSCVRDTSEFHVYELSFIDSPAAVGAVDYAIRLGVSSGNFTINGVTGSGFFGGTLKTTLLLEEII